MMAAVQKVCHVEVWYDMMTSVLNNRTANHRYHRIGG